MPALLLTFILPILPFLIRKCYHTDSKITKAEGALRYIVYAGIILFLTLLALALMSDDGTSFLEKMDKSAGFALKYACMQVLFALGISAAEWIYLSEKVTVRVNWAGLSSLKTVIFFRKYISPYGLYALALFVACLNVSMVNDNAVWADEAFSAMTAQNSVQGIMQILYYWDSHPPLYYLWLKCFGDLFGHTVTVYHAASLVPFLAGIVFAVTLLKKHLGKVAAAFFVMVSGLGAACIQYNLEIRMYSLAFAALAFAAYCAYRVICAGQKKAWIGLVGFSLAAAYSHYYGLVAAGILVFCTGAAVWLRYRGRAWLKWLLAVLSFIIGYIPWLIFMYISMGTFGSADLWITEIMGLDKCIHMVWGADGMSTLLFPLFVFVLCGLTLSESGIFRLHCKKELTIVEVEAPSLSGWSDETWFMLTSTATIAGTLLFGYLFSLIVSPLLVERYLYPLCAVTMMSLAAGIKGILNIFKKLGQRLGLVFAEGLGKAVFVLILCMLFAAGVRNYNAYYVVYDHEKIKTDLTLTTIGVPDRDAKMVTVGVRHLGWTVLEHYFPDNEIVNGDHSSAECDEFWYFVMPAIDEAGLKELKDKGYEVTHYGLMQLSQYPFELYHIVR